MNVFFRNFILLGIFQVLSLTAIAAQPFMNDYLQTVPELKVPGVGSLQGSLARFNPGPTELTHGSLSFPLSITVDESRGPLQINPFPSYSNQQGLSEWGQGLESQLLIQRFRSRGDLNFVDDDFTSPWGHVVRGNDGAYYAKGLKTPLRLTISAEQAEARLGDGSVWTFRRILPSVNSNSPYGYALTEVRSLIGDRTSLTWDEGARPLLKEIAFGGKSADHLPYLIRYNYENLPQDNVSYSYRSKKLVQLTKRIQSLQFFDLAVSPVAARWSYSFLHEFSGYSPAFYLVSYQKTYASGASEPAIKLSYEKFDGMISSLSSQKTDRLNPLMTTLSAGAIRSRSLSFYDYDNDGLIDVEVASNHKLYRQTAEGFQEIADFEPQANWQPCLPPENADTPARRILRLTGPYGRPLVFMNLPGNTFGTTRLLACELNGSVVYDQVFPQDFSPSGLVTLGDLNGDQKPDLIRYTGVSLEFLENVSSGDTVKFQYRGSQSLDVSTPESNLALADVNGDGIPDLFLHEGSFARVFFGKGQFEFLKKPLTFPYFSAAGQPYTVGSDAAVSFVDANGDGLLDLAVSHGREFFLLMNQGFKYRAVPMPFTEGRENEGEALPINIRGNGSPMVFRSSGSKDIFATELSKAGVGLLKSIDDGQGNQITLSYAWQDPRNTKVQLQKQLVGMERFSLGKGSSKRTWEYGPSALGSETPTLLGYETVKETSPGLETRVAFQNPEESPGLAVSVSAKDTTGSQLEKYNITRYEAGTLRGLRTWYKREQSDFHRSAGVDTEPFTQVYSYHEQSLCLKATTARLGLDQMVTQREYAEITGMEKGLACPLQSIARESHHSRKDFDFNETLKITLNELAQPTAIQQINGSGQRLLQEIDYDGQHRLVRFKEQTGLVHDYSYESDSRLIDSATTSVGVQSAVTSRHPNGAIKQHRMSHGSDSFYEQTFAYDGYERLVETRNSLSPDAVEILSYAFGSMKSPGHVHTVSQLDDQVSQESQRYFTADGELIAQAQTLQSGRILDELHAFDSSQRFTVDYSRTEISDDFSSAWADYQARTSWIRKQYKDGLDSIRSVQNTHEQSLVESLSQKGLIEDRMLVSQETINQSYKRLVRTDSQSRIVGRRDEAGFWVTFQYDMANRLRTVTLPDGTTHTASYDNWGQLTGVVRSSLGSVAYRYNSQGLVVQKDFLDRGGIKYRSEAMSYDPFGRLIRKVSAGSSGAEQAYSYYYDGFTPTPEIIPAQKGFLTAVKGPHFTTKMIYDAKGRVIRRTQSLERSGVRKTVAQSFYNDDRLKTAEITVEVEGHTQRSLWEHKLRSDGLLSEIWLNGSPFAKLTYDELGRLLAADLNQSQWNLNFSYDPVTSRISGYRAEGQKNHGAYGLHKDDRGRIKLEDFDGLSKAYRYDERSYLTAVESSFGSESFSYDSTGLLNPQPSGLGGFAFDSIGRLQQKNGMALTYDGQGQITSVRMGDDNVIGYAYDQDGLRNLKLKNGNFHSAQLGGTYISKDHIMESMKIGDTIVGYFDNGSFQPLLGDFRGSVFNTGSGSNVASAYGKRQGLERWQSIIDFSGHARDSDTGLMRMGVRDYDAEQGRFIEPDPLFLENIESCVQSPVECGLFGYAGNDPIRYADPTGLKYEMGHWVFENKDQIESAVKEANQKLIDAGYKDEDFTIVVTGGDRYEKNGKIYSSTENTVVKGSSPTSKHLEKRAFDFEVHGIERSEASSILKKVDNFAVDDKYESDNHIHITVKEMDRYAKSSDTKVETQKPGQSAHRDEFEKVKQDFALDKIAIRKRCLENDCSGKK